MIYTNKSNFTSPSLVMEYPDKPSQVFVTVHEYGVVGIELLQEDNVWRSFPETTLQGPQALMLTLTAKEIRLVIGSAPVTVQITGVKEKEEEVVVPEEPPVVVEPEVPVTPPEPVVEYATSKLNDYTSEYWNKGVWIFSPRSGINIPATTETIAQFTLGKVVRFNADNSQRIITEVQVVGSNISLWFGPALEKLNPAIGYPATISTILTKETPPVVVVPTNNKIAGGLIGVNLASGTFSDENNAKLPGIYGTDYIYPSNADFSRWKARNVTHVRVPFRTERVFSDLSNNVNLTEINRIKEVFQLANTYNMKIELDMHNYAQRLINGVRYDIGSSQYPQSSYNAYWLKMHSIFGADPALYGFCIMNEPMGMGGRWTAIAQSVIDAIRAVDKEVIIFVNGDQWATPLNWAAANPGFPLKGGNIVYEAHLYFDPDAGGKYKTVADVKDSKGNVIPRDQIGIYRASKFVEWLKENDEKGIIGEIGWPENSIYDETARKTLKYLSDNGMRTMMWMAGSWLPATNPLAIEIDGVPRGQVAIMQEYQRTITEHGPVAYR